MSAQIFIIAHGSLLREQPLFAIPSNTVLHTVPLDSKLYCVDFTKTALNICNRSLSLPHHYIGPTTINFDVYLVPDKFGVMNSGVFECEGKSLKKIMEIPKETTLRTILTEINKLYKDTPKHINLLACMGEEGSSMTSTRPTIIHPYSATIMNWGKPETLKMASDANAIAAQRAAASVGGGGATGGGSVTGVDPRRVARNIAAERAKSTPEDLILKLIMDKYSLSKNNATFKLKSTRKTRKLRKTSRRNRK